MPDNTNDPDYASILPTFIKAANLESFYPYGIADPKVKDIVSRAPQAHSDWLDWANTYQAKGGGRGQFKTEFEEFFMGFLKLALYDIYVLVDDSGSMYQEQRITHLKEQLRTILDVDLLFESNGVRIEFLNRQVGVSITDKRSVQSEIDKVMFNGPTRLGTELERKILREIFKKSERGELEKPCLVYIITDGEPMGEQRNHLGEVISSCKAKLTNESAIAFGIVQVGTDAKARKFLGQLESNEGVQVHVTADLEQENEYRRKKKWVQVTSQFLTIQTLIGAIESTVRLNEKEEEGEEEPDSD